MYIHFLQLEIVSYDSTTPSARGSTTMAVTVRRNENKPIFTQTAYEMTINSTYPLGYTIVSVLAADKDQSVSPSLQYIAQLGWLLLYYKNHYSFALDLRKIFVAMLPVYFKQY